MSTSSPAARPMAAPFDLATIGRGLVFAQCLPALTTALTGPEASGAAVVQAPPGTGKTTLVPPLLANLRAGLGSGRGTRTGEPGRILVTQPRRVAVRSAARRLASLDGSPLGERVGYTVRGEQQLAAGAVVEFLTPGILLRRLLTDPGLDGVAAVILDEVHERGLDTDLLLGLLVEVRQLREDLTVVAMSATLDAPRFAQLLADDAGAPAPVVDSPAALFPLETVWAPAPVPRLTERGINRAFLDHVADTAVTAHARVLTTTPAADTLVFAPGAYEVGHIAARLRHTLTVAGDGTEVLELHGQIPAAAQDNAVAGRRPGGAPRIIVSTSLAESSLTVPGVRLVVDAGLSREPRRDAARGMTGLVTVSSSRASSIQRAGRAARLGPGTVVRCFDQPTFAQAPAHPQPEIAVADLSSAALTLACWGAPGGVGLALPDPPPARALADALSVLHTLGALTAEGHATATGRQLASIPADPRLARALLDGARLVGATRAAEAVALVASEARADGADLPGLLRRLRSGADPAARRWANDVRRFTALVRRAGAAGAADVDDAAARAGSSGPGTDARAVPAEEVLGFVIALAYPDRVARRVAGAGEQFLFTSGTRAGLPSGSALSGQQWLVVADVSRAQSRDTAGTGALIRAAAPLSEDSAQAAAAPLATEEVTARFVQGAVTARRTRALGAIVLASTPVKATPVQGAEAVAAALRGEGLGLLRWSPGADALRRRLALIHRELGDPWPDVRDAALLACLDDWLAPELAALAAGRSAASLELGEPLRRLLPWPAASRLGEWAPERLSVPSGSQIRISYPALDEEAGRPVVAVKLQECFGWAATPRLVQGRVPVLFHLLSPAGRPLAVTDDLASFWAGPYRQVRAEMRGRYPKHPWPEDPWTATATAKVTSKM